MKFEFSKEQISKILNAFEGNGERAAMPFKTESIEAKENIVTIRAIAVPTGVLNNYDEFYPLEELTTNAGRDNIVINVEHDNDFLKVLDFNGKLSVESVEIDGQKVKALVVTFEVKKDTHPDYYRIAQAGNFRNFSISAYQRCKVAVNPLADWGSDEMHDRFKKYKDQVLADLSEVSHFYVVEKLDVWGVSPVLYPSHRKAFALGVSEREAQTKKDVFDILKDFKSL